jgi:hypothetical protein
MVSVDNDYKRWITVLEKVTFQYKVAVHSSTNRSPFDLFLKRDNFNTVTKKIEDDDDDFRDNRVEELINVESNEFEGYQVNIKYLNRMDKKCVHNSKNDFNSEDTVIIKKILMLMKRTKDRSSTLFILDLRGP